MRQFGLLGKKLGHSFSKKYFTEKFNKLNLRDCKYELYELERVQEFTTLVKENNFSGLNVTIPYKEHILPYLDKFDPVVEQIGACNTIAFQNDKLIGYNTDVIGFEKSLIPYLAPIHSSALILGNGGASKAVQYVLKKRSIPFFIASRTPQDQAEVSYSELDSKTLARFKLIINTTPLGMHPNTKEMPKVDCSLLTEDHLVYDLIYQPAETLFLSEAKKRGATILNGLSMLRLQAEASWKIWNE